ncbi:MAG: hypothetical protein KatS3mg011_1768 [Acidimicrobiia bacterium]|nr:MAG: hypothetical protein KatS3mg011_1768 [Acidimicrobiia bacterium]
MKGKALEMSVLDLLGGAVHKRLPAVASGHAQHESIPQMIEEAVGWLSGGLRGIKIGFGKRGNARLGYEHDRDVEYVRQMREAIGADRMLMIDLGWAIKWDVPTAVRRAVAFEDYRIDWLEGAPRTLGTPRGYRNLRAKTTIGIAYGEKEWVATRLRAGCWATETVDVVGVRSGACGEASAGSSEWPNELKHAAARSTPMPGRLRS